MSERVYIRKVCGNFSPLLMGIPKPPAELYVRGELPPPHFKMLTVVGSRNYTSYGADVVRYLIKGLAGYNISIVSGLALGIDALAHEYALEYGLHTTAVMGSGLAPSVIYPASNRGLAGQIISCGGCLISEFEPDFKATHWSFPQRNRIVAGLSDAVLVIEAEYKSGTRITADLALEYGRTVMAIPGSIFSDNSKGTNALLARGASIITSPQDILREFGFEREHNKSPEKDSNIAMTPPEATLLGLLHEPKTRGQIIDESGLNISDVTILLTLLEIKGVIREEHGLIRRIL